MTSAISATATFTLNNYLLTVTKMGSGTVTGSMIDCGSTCSASYPYNTSVSLSAMAAAGFRFDRWTGDCSGSGACVVTMSAARNVQAVFIRQRTLTINISGPGTSPLVTVVDGGGSVIGTCAPSTCMFTVDDGAALTLTAGNPYAPYMPFTGWGGACSTAGLGTTCNLDMTIDRTASASYRLVNVAFVTSTTSTGNMGGLSGADAACMTRAAAAGLPGNYVAWLSTSAATAPSRLGTASGWVRPDGNVFARSAMDIVTGRIIHPLNLDENGADVRGATGSSAALQVWTGVLPDGTSSTNNCSSWTSALAVRTADVGGLDRTTGGWTAWQAARGGDQLAHIYCLGTDYTTSMTGTAPPVGVAFAFLANNIIGGSTGLSYFDTQCQSQAMMLDPANASGYRAYIATTGMSARSRVSYLGPWYRPDGTLVATDRALDGAMPFASTISQRADGSYIPNVPSWMDAETVWTGMANGPAAPATAGTQTCANWSVSSSTSTPVGDPESTLPGGPAGGHPGWARGQPGPTDCLARLRVYCLRAM